jgi:hypothetical protein
MLPNFEDYRLLGYNAVYFGKSPTLQRNILLPPSLSNSKPSEKPKKQYVLRNVRLFPNYTALQPRITYSSQLPP